MPVLLSQLCVFFFYCLSVHAYHAHGRTHTFPRQQYPLVVSQSDLNLFLGCKQVCLLLLCVNTIMLDIFN